jgi:hypothetical protein
MGEHLHGFRPEDPAIVAPPELLHQGTDLERFITWSKDSWYAPEDDGDLTRVSKDWVRCWLERCGFFGLLRRFP